MFLSFLREGLENGNTIQEVLIQVAGMEKGKFRRKLEDVILAMSNNNSFGEALEKNPGILPSHIIKLIQNAEKSNNIRKTIHVCEKLLKREDDRLSYLTKYFVIILSIPAMLAFMSYADTFVIPRLHMVFRDLGLKKHIYFVYMQPIVKITVLFLSIILLILLRSWYTFFRYGVNYKSLLSFYLPWRKKKLEQHFLLHFSMLFDSGFSESDSITLAVKSTENPVYIQQGKKAVVALEKGQKLQDAIHFLDRDGVLKWNIANTARKESSLFDALESWIDVLEAKAFQREQVFLNVVFTLLTIIHSVIVAFITITVFQSLISIVNEVLLW